MNHFGRFNIVSTYALHVSRYWRNASSRSSCRQVITCMCTIHLGKHHMGTINVDVANQGTKAHTFNSWRAKPFFIHEIDRDCSALAYVWMLICTHENVTRILYPKIITTVPNWGRLSSRCHKSNRCRHDILNINRLQTLIYNMHVWTPKDYQR